jgi:ribosomal protein S18 acetylase RimI-like enzyme
MIWDKKFLHRFDTNIRGKFSYLPAAIESMEVNEESHLLCIDSTLPSDMFNILCCNGAADFSSICDRISHFRSKKQPFAFWIGFEDEPSWIEAKLHELGLITDEMEWAMVCDLTRHELENDLCYQNIRRFCNKDDIFDLIYVLKQIVPKQEHDAIESFYLKSEERLLSENSQLTFFVSYENKKPVAIVSLYVTEEIASIFDLIVLPEMRGKGLGKLMTQRGMFEAKKKGCKQCILTATNDAKHLYQKLGFLHVKTMKVYHDKL